MANKELQLFILRYVEEGHALVELENLNTILPNGASCSKPLFSEACAALKGQKFLIDDTVFTDKPAIRYAFLSPYGREYLEKNTSRQTTAMPNQTTNIAPSNNGFQAAVYRVFIASKIAG